MNAQVAITAAQVPAPAPLRAFVTALTALLDAGAGEDTLLDEGGILLSRLVAQDDWLPDAYARPDAARYQQYLLHRDAQSRFSVVSFVWGPGQSTPIHDHRVWGLVGVLRGAERVEQFRRRGDGTLEQVGTLAYLHAGAIEAIGPRRGDIHRVTNGLDDAPSISIHVYGADIGTVARATYAPDGTERPFVSGYADAPLLALS